MRMPRSRHAPVPHLAGPRAGCGPGPRDRRAVHACGRDHERVGRRSRFALGGGVAARRAVRAARARRLRARSARPLRRPERREACVGDLPGSGSYSRTAATRSSCVAPCARAASTTSIRELVAADRIAYGGESAGAIVAGPTLRGLELGDDTSIVPSGYRPCGRVERSRARRLGAAAARRHRLVGAEGQAGARCACGAGRGLAPAR